MSNFGVDNGEKRRDSARPGSVRRELELREGLCAIGDVLVDWFEERGREAHQRAEEARFASANANTPQRVHEIAEAIAKADGVVVKCAVAVQMVKRDLPVVSLARMLAEMDVDEARERFATSPVVVRGVNIKSACEACGDVHGPWGLDKQKRFLCESCLKGREPWEPGQ